MNTASFTEDRLGTDGDTFYARLIAAHEGLTPEESAALNARLVLVLANAVGDANTVIAAIDVADQKPSGPE